MFRRCGQVINRLADGFPNQLKSCRKSCRGETQNHPRRELKLGCSRAVGYNCDGASPADKRLCRPEKIILLPFSLRLLRPARTTKAQQLLSIEWFGVRKARPHLAAAHKTLFANKVHSGNETCGCAVRARRQHRATVNQPVVGCIEFSKSVMAYYIADILRSAELCGRQLKFHRRAKQTFRFQWRLGRRVKCWRS